MTLYNFYFTTRYEKPEQLTFAPTAFENGHGVRLHAEFK